MRFLVRIFYTFAWYLALPLVLARLWWRGRKEPGYRQHLLERLGFYSRRDSAQKVIWVHAVSVGETRAAEPLIQALLNTYPKHDILLTHMTPTGRATGQSLFAKHGARIQQAWLPYDIGWMLGRFIRQFSPSVCVLMETEVWPNLMAQCVKCKVPVALVNARLSLRSLKKAQYLSSLLADAVQGFDVIAAQAEADAERIRELGALHVHVAGNMKFDVEPLSAVLERGAQLRQQIGHRLVLLCASTREGEEALILDAIDALHVDNVLVIIVPRHPQRFEAVALEILSRNITMHRRTMLGDGTLANDVRVLLGDSMGEMFAYYAACDLAFIGGSLLPLGGQNLIEACALAKPVLIGQHTFNFATVSEDAIAAGAAVRVADAKSLMNEAACLLKSKEQCEMMGARAQAFALRHRGATSRTLALLHPLVEAHSR